MISKFAKETNEGKPKGTFLQSELFDVREQNAKVFAIWLETGMLASGIYIDVNIGRVTWKLKNLLQK